MKGSLRNCKKHLFLVSLFILAVLPYGIRAQTCGNSVCEPGETAGSCPQDCFAKGVYAMCGSPRTSPCRDVAGNSGVVGVLLAPKWKEIELRYEEYNWTALDQQVAIAQNAGLKVTFQLFDTPYYAPDWLKNDPNVQKVTLINLNDFVAGGSVSCEELTLPVFWDPIFLEKNLQLIRAMGEHYAGNPAVIGVTANTASLFSADGSVPQNNGTCTDEHGNPVTVDQAQSWLDAGYTHERMLQVGKAVIDATATAFPNQAISTYFSISNDTRLEKNVTALAEDVMGYGYSKYPARFYAKMAWLSANTTMANDLIKPYTKLERMLLLLKSRSPQIGIQMIDMATNGEARDCRQNNKKSPCPAYEVMNTSLNISFSYNPTTIEVWFQDANNTQLEPLFVEATKRIGGSPRDTTQPSVPAGLSAIAVSPFQINLNWNPAMDNVGVAGYKIYRNGTYIASAQSTNYQDTGLSPSTAYAYVVSAYDAAGNEGGQSYPAFAATLSCSRADLDCDGCVCMDELSAFIAKWKANSQDVTLKELMGAVNVWHGCHC